MSQFVDALAQARSEIRRQQMLLLVAAGVAAYAIYGWRNATQELTVHLPPDLRNGATIKAGLTPDVPPPNVYTFAVYIWQQLNRWQTDGSVDYGQQIYNVQHFITPSCRAQLLADQTARHNKGELAKRTRAWTEIPGLGYVPERVTVVDRSSWQVLADAQLLETVNGVNVKDAYLRYPLRVVRYDIDPEKNPWQLAVDCYGKDRPERLDPQSVEVAQRDHKPESARKAAPAPVSPLDATAVVEPITLPDARGATN